MKVTMDRYGAEWGMVELGWKTHVRGEGSLFPNVRAAIEALRGQNPGVLDQDLPPFVIERDGKAIGPVESGDSFVFFNFRGDRAIEISRAFEEEEFSLFDRGPKPDVFYAGMMQYDGDLALPKKFLVSPPGIVRTLGEYLVASGVRQMAISETQKFGHVTYFFNGNRSGQFDEGVEDYIEVPSDRVPFEERPWMKAAEITDKVLQGLRRQRNKYGFIRLNLANGDMVGHTGVFEAVRIAVEAVDLSIGRILEVVREQQGILVITADHGNADDMYERDKKTGTAKIDAATGLPKSKTSHSLNPVPCYIYDPSESGAVTLAPEAVATGDEPALGIASLAATCVKLLGFEPPEDYAPSIVNVG